MKNKFNEFIQRHYRTDSNIPNFTYNKKNNIYNLNEIENQFLYPNYNKEFENLKTTINTQRNDYYKKNLFSNHNSNISYRPNSVKKIKKTISFFNTENISNGKYRNNSFFDNEILKKKKIEKVIPGSRKVEEFKKNLEDDLKLFKNYKPMKRYFISNLRNVPSIYERNFFSPPKKQNPLNNYKHLYF